jgi:hypothetical protein
MGEPSNADLQRRIMLAAFNLLPRAVSEPLIVRLKSLIDECAEPSCRI